MSQFSVYRNPHQKTNKTYPYLLEIQSPLLDDLVTTVVIPLALKSHIGTATISKLNPFVDIEGVQYVVLTQQLAGIERKNLGPKTHSLESYRSDIMAAIDFVTSGI